MNVDSSVNISNKHVNAVVFAGNTSVSADVDVNNRNVQSEVQQRNGHVEAQAQTRSGNVHTEVNQHISVVNDHSRLQNLDYDNAGHIGFQRALTEDNAGTGISIETDPVTGDVTISNTQTSAEWGNIEGNIENQTDLNSALNNLSDSIDYVQMGVDAIEELIPVQATSHNQLADKDFVNSSIATSTATFRGTYNVVTDLHLSTSATHQQVATALGNTISVADNNDYCFVEIPTSDLTPTETLQVDRYKYNGTSWSFEYTLNNSGYTSAQWKAINSGITSGKVTQYDDYSTSKQDTIVAGTNITIGTDGKTISSDIPQATQSVAGKVLLGASGGAATYESVGDGKPICYPTTASEVTTTSMLVKSSVSDNGKILTENGFVYNTSGNPTISDTKVICDLCVGFFEKKLENLTPNTEYHIKSYGQNASGLVYGSELIQRTPSSPIPAEYQLVEYITSDGNQYINSNILVTNSISWYFDAIIVNTNEAQTGCGSVQNNYFLFVVQSNKIIFYCGPRLAGEITQGYWVNTRVTLFIDQYREKYGIVNVTEYPLSSFSSANLSIYIGRRNGATQKMACTIYNSKIFDYNILIQDLYPVYRKSDNKPGMYDIVNNVFYINQGTGEFTVGPDKVWSE